MLKSVQLIFHHFQFTLYTFLGRGKPCWSSITCEKSPRKILLPNHFVTASSERVPKEQRDIRKVSPQQRRNSQIAIESKWRKRVCLLIDELRPIIMVLCRAVLRVQGLLQLDLVRGKILGKFYSFWPSLITQCHCAANCDYYRQLTNKQ